MSSLRLETVFVGYVGYGVRNAIRAGILELTADSDGFLFRSSVDDVSFFLSRDSVAGFISEK